MPHLHQRPRWRKKRWIAAAVLWLFIGYPLSIGPYLYCIERGWLHGWGWLWDPVAPMLGVPPVLYGDDEGTLLWRCWRDCAYYFRDAGIRHRQLEMRAEK
jgi:hypothetical protein